ncbi:helix-turn-helix domain-containing protein [Clostridium cochlearium]|uniref:helix-turn-helix domain-containing protein n=1 Tax=Clostridium cochlearium TaxID=1494 RepID=UPI000BBBE6AA|nr:helix-turn-helix domain-containing protein [Clostridium cochlearium]
MKLEDIMDLKEASEKYNLNINTLKTICQKGLHNLSEDVDYKKTGRVWLITRKAIEEKILKNKH